MSFQCLHTVFPATSVLKSLTSSPGNMDVSVWKFCIYVCFDINVSLFVFLYGYLFYNVVYNTVVCINTIIYFSTGGAWGGREHKRTTSWRQIRWDSLVHWRKFFLRWGRNWYPANKQKQRYFSLLLPTLIWSYWFFWKTN